MRIQRHGYCVLPPFDLKRQSYETMHQSRGISVIKYSLPKTVQGDPGKGSWGILHFGTRFIGLPHYGDINHPQRNNPAAKGVERDFQRYLDYMHGQIKELLTNYGQLDIMWFDFSYPKMAGETWQPQKIM